MRRPKDGGLIIVRQEGERVYLHDNGDVIMTVKVIQTGKKVSLLFSDPNGEMDIDRQEVFIQKFGGE